MELPKKLETYRGKTSEALAKWEWTRETKLAFRKLKRTFTEALIFQHVDPARPIILQNNACGFATVAILNLYDVFRVPRPVNFYFRKCSPGEPNYNSDHWELLAVMETLKQWRHHLKGANYNILIRCDHTNLKYFQTSKVLSRRQDRWLENLSADDLVIELLEVSKDPADSPSRQPDYEIGYETPIAGLLATISVEPYNNLMPAIITAQASDPSAVDLSANVVDRPMIDGTDTPKEESHWKGVTGVLTDQGRISVRAVDSLRGKVTSLFHVNPESGQFGAPNTTQLVSRDFYWPVMDSRVRKYVSGCEVCHRIKVPWHARHENNLFFETPSWQGEAVTMDFVTDLPESTALSHTGILVIVAWLKKMAIYLPWRKDIDSLELALLFFENLICKRGVLENIVTNCGTQFTSRFWTSVCSHLSTDYRLSTPFHPQMDGLTEGQNQTMEQYLRAFCNYEQDNWVELLPLAEFAYNNMIYTSTKMTPFWANYHYHQVTQFNAPKQPSSLNSEIQADTFVAGLEETHQTLRRDLEEAQAIQMKYTGGKQVVFEIGDFVWHSTRHFRTTRPSKKLDSKHTGPYTVGKVINKNAYKLDLP